MSSTSARGMPLLAGWSKSSAKKSPQADAERRSDRPPPRAMVETELDDEARRSVHPTVDNACGFM